MRIDVNLDQAIDHGIVQLDLPADSGVLIQINGEREVTSIRPALAASRSPKPPSQQETMMANAPVEVKRTEPAPISTLDVWRSFRNEFDRLFDRFSPDRVWPTFPRMFGDGPYFSLRSSVSLPTPAMDVSEDADAYKVTAELPGMNEKEIEVAVTDGTLTLTGQKQREKEQKDENYYLSEREYGSFKRSFVLPDGVDVDKISADFAKGVLTITLPKKPEAKAAARKVEVKASA